MKIVVDSTPRVRAYDIDELVTEFGKIRKDIVVTITDAEFEVELKELEKWMDSIISTILTPVSCKPDSNSFSFSFIRISFKSFKKMIDLLIEKIKYLKTEIEKGPFSPSLEPMLLDQFLYLNGTKSIIFSNNKFLAYFCDSIINNNVSLDSISLLYNLFSRITFDEHNAKNKRELEKIRLSRKLLDYGISCVGDNPQLIISLLSRVDAMIPVSLPLEKGFLKMYFESIEKLTNFPELKETLLEEKE